MITNLYIDGFNLYYRALKDTPLRWLDLRKLAEALFPQDEINRVCYFTAVEWLPSHFPERLDRPRSLTGLSWVAFARMAGVRHERVAGW